MYKKEFFFSNFPFLKKFLHQAPGTRAEIKPLNMETTKVFSAEVDQKKEAKKIIPKGTKLVSVRAVPLPGKRIVLIAEYK